LMTNLGLNARISSTVFLASSASRAAVWMVREVSSLTVSAMPRQRDSVRLANRMSENVSWSWAHLCATTLPTPPAPMIKTRFMLLPYSATQRVSAASQPMGPCLAAGQRRANGFRSIVDDLPESGKTSREAPGRGRGRGPHGLGRLETIRHALRSALPRQAKRRRPNSGRDPAVRLSDAT
jgi:hypothetical protein